MQLSRRVVLAGLGLALVACSDSAEQGGDPPLDVSSALDGGVDTAEDTQDHDALGQLEPDGQTPPIDAGGALDAIAPVETTIQDPAPAEVSGAEDAAPLDAQETAETLDGQEALDVDLVADGAVSLDGEGPEPADIVALEDTPGSEDAETAPDVVSDALSDVGAEVIEDGGPAPGGDGGVSADVTLDAAGDLEEVVEPAPLYLLSVNNATHTLEKIDVATGAGTDLCQLATPYSYPSLTFSRDNVLYASRTGSTLDVIDPCTCTITTVGPYNGFTGVNGITSDFGLNLFGVAHNQDVLISINTTTGQGASIGDLGVNFGYTGATWSEDEQVVYAIDASSDGLYLISPDTGAATLIAPLSQPMGTVGIEMHPANGLLYACSDAAHLLEIDIATGEVTDIGDMGQNTACNNLAAPWKPVACLE